MAVLLSAFALVFTWAFFGLLDGKEAFAAGNILDLNFNDNTNDQSGNNLTVSSIGSTAYEGGSVAVFSGSNYIKIPHSDIMNTDDISINFTIDDLKSLPSSDAKLIVRDGTSGNRIFQLALTSDGKLYFIAKTTEDPGWGVVIISTKKLTAGQSYDIEVSFDQTNGASLTVNGENWGTDNNFNGTLKTGTAPIEIGGTANGGWNLKASVDDVEISGSEARGEGVSIPDDESSTLSNILDLNFNDNTSDQSGNNLTVDSIGSTDFEGGSSVVFSGDNYLQIPHSEVMNTDEISINLTLEDLKSLPSSDAKLIVRDGTSGNRIFQLALTSDGKLYFIAKTTEDPGWGVVIISTKKLTAGQSYDIEVSFDQTNGASLTVNGENWGTDNNFNGTLKTGTAPIEIGGTANGGWNLKASVNDVEISGSGVSESGSEEGSGEEGEEPENSTVIVRHDFRNDANDSSGNENHSTEHGSVSYKDNEVAVLSGNDRMENFSSDFNVDIFEIKTGLKLNSLPSVSSKIVLRDDLSSRLFQVLVLSNGRIQFIAQTTNDSGWGINAVTSNKLVVGQFYNLVFSFDQINGAKITVDGEAWAEDKSFYGFMKNGGAPLEIGGTSKGRWNIDAEFNYLQFSGRNLAEAEKAEYEANHVVSGHTYGEADIESDELGPIITVGLHEYTKSSSDSNSLKNSSFRLTAEKASTGEDIDYVVKDRNGNVVVNVSAGYQARVKYDGDKKFRVYHYDSNGNEVLVDREVRFEAKNNVDKGDVVFKTNAPVYRYGDMQDYRDGVKLKYYDVSGSSGDRIWLINYLPLEHYVWGMCEIRGTGDRDYNRVMTTSYRTYGYWKIKIQHQICGQGIYCQRHSGESTLLWL